MDEQFFQGQDSQAFVDLLSCLCAVVSTHTSEDFVLNGLYRNDFIVESRSVSENTAEQERLEYCLVSNRSM